MYQQRSTWQTMPRWSIYVVLLVLLSGLFSIVVPARTVDAASRAGTALAWGRNSDGQLGDGTTVEKSDPVQVKGVGGNGTLGGIIAIASAGGDDSHTLALRSDGTVLAWGKNSYGQLGNGTTTASTTPISVSSVDGTGALSQITAIAAVGNHSLALKSDGTVFAWGKNSAGQLGIGSTTNQSRPIQVKGPGGSGTLSNVKAIAAGYSYSIAILADGSVLGWGDNNAVNDTPASTTPSIIPGLGPGSGVVAVGGGESHYIALKSDGTLLAWGLGDNGQLGVTNPPDRCQGSFRVPCAKTPVAVEGISGSGKLSGVKAIDVSAYSSQALLTDGTVVSWAFQRKTPTPVSGLGSIVAIAGTLALKADGTVLDWNESTPVQVKGVDGNGTLSGVTAIFASNSTASKFALTALDFADLGSLPPATVDAIRQLAARGVIKGCDQEASPPLFCPNDPTLRAQMAALIARAVGWDAEDHNNTFPDRCRAANVCIDADLWRNVGTLQFYGVAKGFQDGTYNPFGEVLYAQTISFITRAMVQKGYWTQATADDGTVYPNIPASSGHRLDFVTYVNNVGPVPGTTAKTENFDQWNQPSTRAWFALALWQAIKDR